MEAEGLAVYARGDRPHGHAGHGRAQVVAPSVPGASRHPVRSVYADAYSMQARVYLFDWVAATLAGRMWSNIPVDFFTRLWRTSLYTVAITFAMPLAAWYVVHRFQCSRQGTARGVRVGVLILLTSTAGVCVSSAHKYFFEDVAAAMHLTTDTYAPAFAWSASLSVATTLLAVALQVVCQRFIEHHERPNDAAAVWIARSAVVSFWSTLGYLWNNLFDMLINNDWLVDIDGLLSLTILATFYTIAWLVAIRFAIPLARHSQPLYLQRVLVTLRMLSVDMVGRGWTDVVFFACTQRLATWVGAPHGGYVLAYGSAVLVGALAVAAALLYAKRVSFAPRYVLLVASMQRPCWCTDHGTCWNV